MTKPETFNTESPYLQNSDPDLERNINILYENMFKTQKSSLDHKNTFKNLFAFLSWKLRSHRAILQKAVTSHLEKG